MSRWLILVSVLPGLCLAAPSIKYPSSSSAVVTPISPAVRNIVDAVNASPQMAAEYVAGLIGRVHGSDVAMQARAGSTAGQVARALAGAAGVVTGAAAVAALSWAASNVRCRYTGSEWKCDLGESPRQELGWEATASDGTKFRDTDGDRLFTALKQHTVTRLRGQANGASIVGEVWHGQGSCSVVGELRTLSCGNAAFELKLQTNQGMNYSLWAYPSISTPAKVVPICDFGWLSDSLCNKTEDRWDPQTAEQVAPKLEPRVSQQAAPIAQDILDAGKSIETTGPTKVEGPASVQHPPKVTTITDSQGTPQTKTETTTSNIEYTNNTFTWYNTTVINHFDGSTEVITEKPKPDDRTECEKNPDALNCQPRDVPDGPEIPEREIPVTFTPDAGWGGEGQCPAPQTVSVLGQAVTIDNTVVCTFLSGIRPVVVAMFGLAGALIFIGGLKP